MSVLPVHPASINVESLLRDCDVTRSRRSGPGGQHRNKVETAIVITHRPTGVIGQASERRSQEANRQVAVFRLRVNLALEVRSPLAESDSPSQLWQTRCQRRRIAINPQHDDFPAILAEALDRLAMCQFDVKVAAKSLECSASQLVKLLAIEQRALGLVNTARSERGLNRLR
jgi:hypothetical protein